MERKEWYEIAERASRSVFRIRAGGNLGTCFLGSVARHRESGTHLCLFVTAWHVVEAAETDGSEIEVLRHDGTVIAARSENDTQIIPMDPFTFDSAGVFMQTGGEVLKLEDCVPLFGTGTLLRGAEVGWVGFPSVRKGELCFFHGHISGYSKEPAAYLVDGVAVGGCSGGPVFDRYGATVGLVSAYLPDVRRGARERVVLPGLSSIAPIAAVRMWLEEVVKARSIRVEEVEKGGVVAWPDEEGEEN